MQVFGFARDHQGGRGVQQSDIAERRWLAFENVAYRLGVLCCVAATQRFRFDPAQTDVLG